MCYAYLWEIRVTFRSFVQKDRIKFFGYFSEKFEKTDEGYTVLY